MKILITGANGQLGKCIKDVSINYPEYDFLFTGKEELDITSEDSISNLFSTQRFDYCINAAAYTHVEKAETNKKQAFLVNAKGAKYLAKQCNNNNTVLLQISTDYVFDGKKGTPYTEEDQTNPINVYGASKLEGERLVKEFSEKYYIVRTSWLYSNYGHNFYNSITRFAKEGRDLKITTEQTGTPTNALDLSKAILKIISFNSNNFGVYHVSNTGKSTWYDFAKAILKNTEQISTSKLVKVNYFSTFAARPNFSVLNTEKFTNEFGFLLPPWKKSLKKIISK